MYGLLINGNIKFRSTDQSENIGLILSRKVTKQVEAPKKCNPDVKSKAFTCERTQTINSIDKISKPIRYVTNIGFKAFKMEKIFIHDYHHWGAK